MRGVVDIEIKSFNEIGGCNSLLICSMVYAATGAETELYGFIRIIGESLASFNGGKKYFDGMAMVVGKLCCGNTDVLDIIDGVDVEYVVVVVVVE